MFKGWLSSTEHYNNKTTVESDESAQNTDKRYPERAAFKIAAVYMITGILWILLSDKMLGFIVIDKNVLTNVSMIKGWIFILITGVLVYSLVCAALIRARSAEVSLFASYQKLSKTNMELAHAYDQVDESQTKLILQYDELLKNQDKLKAYEKELFYQAYHDQLTGLLNRRALMNTLDRLMQENAAEKIALLLVDIDHFKYINDVMGHGFGDNLLIRMSQRLEGLLENNDAIYRLSGDEFVILLEGYEDSAEVERLAVKLLKGCKEHFEIESSNIFVSISIGISLYPDHGEELHELLKNADIAVYKAKGSGRNRMVFYNKPMNDALAERVLLEKHLRTALDNNEFILHYQPQLDLSTNRISGFEALIRWNSPELGFISPLKFISIAEDTHLIIPIGEWVLKSACSFLKGIQQQGYDDLSVSVNISMLQLLQDDFVDKLICILKDTKLNPRYLELEITESILMESYEAIREKLKLLQGKGIKIALDDFGKGYSSLNYLKQLPIDTLKVDKSFIDTILTDDKDKSLADLIVMIGRALGISVVAEGVETQEQVLYLAKHKYTRIQGYFFSKPIPGEKVIEVIKLAIK